MVQNLNIRQMQVIPIYVIQKHLCMSIDSLYRIVLESIQTMITIDLMYATKFVGMEILYWYKLVPSN